MTDQPDHGCTINGQPAMPILVAEYNQLVARAQATDGELRRQLANTITALGKAETELAGVRALRDRWIKAGAPPLGTSINRWWDKRLAEFGTALDGRRPAGASRHVHVTIRNPDESTANRAALSLVDWINAEFPGHHIVTDAREWDGPAVPDGTDATEPGPA